jgi:amino acid adenylation domain-containing protein
VTPVGYLAARDDRTAIVEPGVGRVTYAELDDLCARVAGRLTAEGIGPGDRVGICLPRSTDAIAAMLGVLRAGAAFIPLDPAAPAERNARIQGDANVKLTLGDLGAVGLGRAIGAWAGDARAPVTEVASDALASVLFTSGSTGKPKGVMMTRGNLDAFAAWIRATIVSSRDDVLATHAHFHFAMSAFDIFGATTSGATLVIIPETARASAERVTELIASEHVTIWFSGPAILSQIAQREHGARLASLRVLAFAGEVFPIAHLQHLRRQLPQPRFLHVWGSTETNVAVVHELDGTPDAPPPIGRPCPHFEHRIADERGDAVAAGMPGELLLRGPAVYAGYLGDPELTAAKRFGDWHRTGDLAIELPSGELRYAGRLGRMLKVRGYRIEPGEIEARLYEHPKVVEAGVVAEGEEGAQDLVAHLRTVDLAKLSLVELKQFCATKLPAYMIPKRFVFHDALPRNANGKIDLHALAGRA